MSERIVNDPSLHGWVEENGKWVWDASGGAGAGMVISETEPTDKVEGMQWLNPTTGLVLFWDDEKWLQMPAGKDGADGADGVDGLWTDNGDTTISYSAGNVGIGVSNPQNPLHLKSAIQMDSPAGNPAWIDKQDAALIVHAGNGSELDLRGDSFKLGTPIGDSRLTIGSTGNATFHAGAVEMPEASGNHFSLSNAPKFTEADTGEQIAHYGMTLDSKNGEYWSRFSGFSGCAFYTKGEKRLTIDATGNATFSGMLTAGSLLASAAFITGSNMAAQIELNDASNGNTTGRKFLRSIGNTFDIVNNDYSQSIFVLDDGGDASFSGRVSDSTGPLMSSRHLIETLSTLRASTLDESVDVRQALASACDKLIEKFEAMQEVATQETSDE